MNRSVQIIALVLVLACAMVSAQSTHFLPPAPARYDRKRPVTASLLTTSNEYINKVFAGAWFRSNFEDLLSYRGANKLEWFEVLLGADCSPVPATGKSQLFSNFLTGRTDDHRIIQENLQN